MIKKLLNIKYADMFGGFNFLRLNFLLLRIENNIIFLRDSIVKKFLSFCLILIMIFSFFSVVPFVALADSGTCGKNLTWSLDKDGVLFINGDGNMEHYNFRQAPWFSNREKIFSIVVGDNVTNISRDAFNGCSWCKNVSIGKSVTNIKYDFSGDGKVDLIDLVSMKKQLANAEKTVLL